MSSDQTLRIWDLKGSNFSNPHIIYDHEEEIMTTAANNSSLMFASIDTDPTILVRDLRNSADVVSTLSKHGGGSFETGFILYNSRVHNELFVFVNNELEVYDADGTVIQRAEFDANIVYAVQDEDVLIGAYQTGGLAVYPPANYFVKQLTPANTQPAAGK